MTKKIEDYLHFHLGCEVKFPKSQSPETNGILMLTPQLLSECHESNEWLYLKPLLRPLSSVTEEEMFEVLNSMVPDYFEDVPTIDEYDFEMFYNDGGNMVDADVAIGANYTCRCFEGQIVIRQDGSIHMFDEAGKAENIYKQPEAFKYLLSHHFDLFGLIESGLANIKTTHHDTIL